MPSYRSGSACASYKILKFSYFLSNFCFLIKKTYSLQSESLSYANTSSMTNDESSLMIQKIVSIDPAFISQVH